MSVHCTLIIYPLFDDIFGLLKTISTLSRDGDLLAVITDKSPNLLIWDANSNRSQWLDTGNVYFLLNQFAL